LLLTGNGTLADIPKATSTTMDAMVMGNKIISFSKGAVLLYFFGNGRRILTDKFSDILKGDLVIQGFFNINTVI
jgi:hypothetical protein